VEKLLREEVTDTAGVLVQPLLSYMVLYQGVLTQPQSLDDSGEVEECEEDDVEFVEAGEHTPEDFSRRSSRLAVKLANRLPAYNSPNCLYWNNFGGSITRLQERTGHAHLYAGIRRPTGRTKRTGGSRVRPERFATSLWFS